MCRSKEMGGQRCATHARAALARAETALTAAQVARDPARVSAALAALDAARAQYASTPQGQGVLEGQCLDAEESLDWERVASLGTALSEGRKIRAAAEVTRQRMLNGGRPKLTVIDGGKPDGEPSPPRRRSQEPPDTFCDWCWTDPGPDGECDCPPVRR